jgi:hypothetical protein
MNFWDILFDSDYKQRADIEALKDSSARRKRAWHQDRQRGEDQQQRIVALEEQVGELTLLCRSLLTCLREAGIVQPEKFQEVMQRIDVEDGVADGKVTIKDKSESNSNAYPKIDTW